MLAKLFEQNQNTKIGCIDQHMFVESLALAAFDIDYSEDISSIEKICYLVERMNQSEGPKIVQKAMGLTTCPTGQDWDILYTIRRRFQWLFQQK